MTFLNIYVNVIRITLIVLTGYYIYKRSVKSIISTAAAFTLTFLIVFLEKAFKIKIDLLGSILYFSIIFMAVYLGGTLKFYDRYSWWDRAVHFLSGIAFVSFGIAFSREIEGLDKFHIAFFSFTFSITLHVMWEILEYIADCVAHQNNQRWQKVHNSNNHISKEAIQPAGLVDTMNDTVVCVLSTAIACIAWWFIL